MGTDSVKLFNKDLADHILAMDREPLSRFIEENIDTLEQQESLVLSVMKQKGSSVSGAVERLLSEGLGLLELKIDVAQSFAFGDEEIYLDYWGCYAEVFHGHPEGSISSLDYLPGREDAMETFILLLPDHVNQMVVSLHEHADDLSIMDGGDVEKLARWRDFCAANPSYMVAYLLDF